MSNFAHLHVHSCFSFLDGTSTPEDLVDAAVGEGMDALAITDTNGLYGAVRFWNAATERGLKPIYGTELTFPGVPPGGTEVGPPALLAKARTGWGGPSPPCPPGAASASSGPTTGATRAPRAVASTTCSAASTSGSPLTRRPSASPPTASAGS